MAVSSSYHAYMHQEVFDSLGLSIPVELVPFQDYSAATMYVDWNIANTIYYKAKDWRFPMSPSEHDRFVYNLYHEYMHVLQQQQGFAKNLTKIKSDSPHSNYSSLNKAEEEAEAFALIMTGGVGCTKLYWWNCSRKVRWVFKMHKILESTYLLRLPEPLWVEQKYQEYLSYNTPPPFPVFK